MTDRPMIFSAPMIRALLAGTKTQTRRLMKPQPVKVDQSGRWYRIASGGTSLNCYDPPCQPGDRLWVREAHALVPASAYRMSDGIRQAVNPDDPDRAAVYREGFDRSTGGLRWRPSIHMPRWASRITLVVTDVRPERVQDISQDDARAEGAPADHVLSLNDDAVHGEFWLTAREWFADTWEGIHGPDAWDHNDWVWRIAFTVHACNIDALPLEARP